MWEIKKERGREREGEKEKEWETTVKGQRLEERLRER